MSACGYVFFTVLFNFSGSWATLMKTVVHSPSRPTWRAVALRESLSCGGMSEGRAARMGSGRGGWVPACSLAAPPSLQEFVKDAGSYSKKLVDDLLDQITGGDHSRLLFQLRQVGALGHSYARRTGR